MENNKSIAVKIIIGVTFGECFCLGQQLNLVHAFLSVVKGQARLCMFQLSVGYFILNLGC